VATYVLQRLLRAVPTVVFSTVLVFLLLRMLPGDPAQVYAGDNATPEILAAVRKDMGLDQPLPIQYLVWLQHVLQADLGTSAINKQPVADLIAQRLPATLTLAVLGVVASVALALVLGITAAVHQGTRVDWAITTLVGVAQTIPNFWLGLLLVLLFSVVLGWLPPSGRIDPLVDPVGGVKSLALPLFTLALPGAMIQSRLVKATMLEVLYDDYVRTARAKGLGPQAVLWRHALRNALIPLITVIGVQFGNLLGGAVIIEQVFGWAGVGTLMLQAIGSRDYKVIQSGLLLLVAVFIVVNLVVDISYGFVDPRVRAGRAR
jgi:peptide/nickel transport system permease protein